MEKIEWTNSYESVVEIWINKGKYGISKKISKNFKNILIKREGKRVKSEL